MNKFKKYKCDTCNKTTEVANNSTHAFIDKCTLTQGCLGRLRFVEETNSQNLSPPEFLYSSDHNAGLKFPSLFSLNCSQQTEVFAAAPISAPRTGAEILELTFSEIDAKEQEFKEFQFNVIVPVSAISGKDHSVDHKILAFSANDEVQVYINGENVDSGNFTAENNLIKFKNPIVYQTFNASSLFVRVLVFAKKSETLRKLVFNSTNPGSSNGAWSNLAAISIGHSILNVFVCSDLSAVKVNTRLKFMSATLNGVQISGTEVHFLLSKAPHGKTERVLTKSIIAQNLDDSVNHLKFVSELGQNSIYATTTSVTNVFPVIKAASAFDQSIEQDSAIDFASTSLDIEPNNNIEAYDPLIIGPV